MKHVLNVLRFLVYLPLCIGLLWGMYYLIGLFLIWILNFSLFWFIVTIFFGWSIIIGLQTYLFGFLAAILSYINPYKKVGGWIVIPIAILLCLLNIFLLWGLVDLSYTKGIFTALIGSGMMAYATISFSTCISINNPKELM